MAIIAVVVALFAGFGAGRIRNAAKLRAIRAELKAVETSAVGEVKTLAARIRAKL